MHGISTENAESAKYKEKRINEKRRASSLKE
jgi:hypothetical protein